MKLHYNIILALFAMSCTSEPENTKPEKYKFASPAEVGMYADSLANIESMVLEFVDGKKYPGAVTLVAKDGKIIYESEVGWSDSSRTEAYRKEHLFRMASMTKPLVSVAAMQLIENEKMSLDDPVGK
ncbi:serine hydrolase domain-containing protein, partial [Reichenbachiella sp.]